MRRWTILAWIALALEALCLCAALIALFMKTGFTENYVLVWGISISVAGLLSLGSGYMFLRSINGHAPDSSEIFKTAPVRVWLYGFVLTGLYVVVLTHVLWS